MARKRSTGVGTRRKKRTTTSLPTEKQRYARVPNHGPSELPTTVVSIDIGTSTFSACHAVKYANRPIEFESSQPLRFDKEASEVGQMIAAWHGDGFHFGFPLSDKRGPDAVPPNKLITSFKLLLYDNSNYKDSRQVSKVKKQLLEAHKSFSELLEQALQYIWTEILSAAESQQLELARDRTIVYLPVPLVATKDATTIMSMAAKKAGIPRVRFVFEPLCAGVSLLKYFLGNRHTEAAYAPYAGSCIQSVDMGGGTTDIVTLRMPPTLEQAKRNRFVVIKADGIVCGSTNVDESFQRWLIRAIEARPGGMKSLAERLLHDEETILGQATAKFQKWKTNPDRGGLLEIRCSRLTDAIWESFELDPALVRSFFDYHIRNIIKLAEDNRTDDTKHMVLSGGFAESKYVKDRITQHFRILGVKVMPSTLLYRQCPVARGALMVDDKLDQSNNISEHSVGLLNVQEDADPENHPDAFYKNGSRVRGVAIRDEVYSKARKRPSYMVEDRITWLIHKGTKADKTGHFTTTEPVFQQFFVPLEDPTVNHTVIFTKKDSTKQHEPFRDRKKNVMNDLYYRTEKTTLSEDFIERSIRRGRQFSQGEVEGQGPQFLEVYCAFGLRHNDMSIEMIRQFVKPETIPHVEEEKWLDHLRDQLQYDDANWEEIFDGNFDFEIIDTRLPDITEERAGPSHRTQPLVSRSPTLQASPQPQPRRQALQQISQISSRSESQQMPYRTSAGPSGTRVQETALKKRAGKRRRIDAENVDSARRVVRRISPTVDYSNPFDNDEIGL